MIHLICPFGPILPVAAQPPGDLGHEYDVKLAEAPWNELDRIRFTTDAKAVFRHCLIILMSHSHQTIMTIVQTCIAAPTRWSEYGGSIVTEAQQPWNRASQQKVA